ncbi:MAG: DUF4832 domain-containing protein [Ruminococcus sp.]|jgi:hypothetical protein|nr:DUF4832 domain-containing protein [Ruminococcus sp.]
MNILKIKKLIAICTACLMLSTGVFQSSENAETPFLVFGENQTVAAENKIGDADSDEIITAADLALQKYYLLHSDYGKDSVFDMSGSGGKVKHKDTEVLKKFLHAELPFFQTGNTVISSMGNDLMSDSGIDYTESTEMLKNPHMGYPSMGSIRYKKEGNTPRNDSGFVWYYFNLNAFSGGNSRYAGEGTPPVGGDDIPITEDALNTFRQTLQNLRNNGGSMFMRIVYDWDGVAGCEPADFEIMLTHIKQVCEVVSDFPDVVGGFECGVIGPFGEMHTSDYASSVYANQIIDTYLDNTPDSMILMVRSSAYMRNYLGKTAEELETFKTEKGSKAYRLCYFNDGYMNSDNDLGTWGDREQELKFLASQSEHAPYGGEYGSAYSILPSNVCLPENAIKEMYYTHVSFMRGNVYKLSDANTYFGYDEYTYSSEYEGENFPDNSGFYGSDCFTFITAHLGYRFVLRNSLLQTEVTAGDTLTVKGSIENTGFANAVHTSNSRVLLVNKDSGDLYSCEINLNPYDIKSTEVYDYNLRFALPISVTEGDYAVYLQFSSVNETFDTRAKSGIKFANNGDIYNSDLGANKLGSLHINPAEKSDNAAAYDMFMQVNSPISLSETTTLPENSVTVVAPSCYSCGIEKIIDAESGSAVFVRTAPLSHIKSSPQVLPTSCTEEIREIIKCELCGEVLHTKISPEPGHINSFTIDDDTVTNSCTVCGEVVWSKKYDNSDLKGDVFENSQAVSATAEPIVLIGDGGFTPSYTTKGDHTTEKGPGTVTFVFEMTGIDETVTLAKFRTQTKMRSNTAVIDSNNSGNYHSAGVCEYTVPEDGYYAFTLNGALVNWLDGGFADITYAAFSDPKTHENILGTPVNNNPDSTFRLAEICDGTPSYDIVFTDEDGNFLERNTGSYNQGNVWANAIQKISSPEEIFTGDIPVKLGYDFVGWADSDGKPITALLGDIIAHPIFVAAE